MAKREILIKKKTPTPKKGTEFNKDVVAELADSVYRQRLGVNAVANILRTEAEQGRDGSKLIMRNAQSYAPIVRACLVAILEYRDGNHHIVFPEDWFA